MQIRINMPNISRYVEFFLFPFVKVFVCFVQWVYFINEMKLRRKQIIGDAEWNAPNQNCSYLLCIVHRKYLCVWEMFEHFESVDLIRYLFWFFDKKEYALN